MWILIDLFIGLLTALLAGACAVSVAPEPEVDTSAADADSETLCSDSYYQQCGDDGHVHWFDACDVQGNIAQECPDNAECVNTSATTAECVCVNQWQGELCEECPGNWDPEKDCGECLPGWSGEDCGDLCVRYVDADSAEGGDGLAWSSAFTRVQQGIEAAREAVLMDEHLFGCHVWVAEGTYYVYETACSDTLLLDFGVSLFGGFAGGETDADERDWEAHPTVLDAYDGPEQNARVYTVVKVVDDISVDGFTITHGNGADWEYLAGGLLVEEASPVITNCRFEDNQGGHVGAIALLWSDAEVINCEFQGNEACDVGGIYIEEGNPIIANSHFVSNLYYTDPEFWFSSPRGGAIHVRLGSPVVDNCVFDHNTAFEVAIDEGSPTFTNCTFVSNVDWDAAGFIFAKNSGWPGTPVIRNSVLVGGGVFAGDVYEFPLFDATGCDFDSGAEVDISHSVVSGGCEGEAILDADPLFVDPEGHDFRLQPGSPCIDAADGTAAPELDIDGNPRVDDPDADNTGIGPPWVDMGAYERQL